MILVGLFWSDYFGRIIIIYYRTYPCGRDLKSDNLFVEDCEGDSPRLVVSDFGECLCVGPGQGLAVHYTTDEIGKGGNISLMAPEVGLCSCAVFAPIEALVLLIKAQPPLFDVVFLIFYRQFLALVICTSCQAAKSHQYYLFYLCTT